MWWLAALAAASASLVITYVFLPPAYLFVKLFADPLSRWFGLAWLLPNTFKFFWGYFEALWKVFVGICKWADEHIVKPVAKRARAFTALLKELWDSVRGKKPEPSHGPSEPGGQDGGQSH